MKEYDSVLHLSKQAINGIKDINYSVYPIIQGIPVFESPVLPFEIYYDACDISTKEPVKIASGEWVHGVMMSPIDFNNIEPMALPIQWQEESTKSNWLKGNFF